MTKMIENFSSKNPNSAQNTQILAGKRASFLPGSNILSCTDWPLSAVKDVSSNVWKWYQDKVLKNVILHNYKSIWSLGGTPPFYK